MAPSVKAAPSTASTLVLTAPDPHRGCYCSHHGFVYTSILVLKVPARQGWGPEVAEDTLPGPPTNTTSSVDST